MGWWFGRILTFELIADAAAPTLGALLADASEGLIECDSAISVDGYAAHGSSIGSALEPLIEHLGIRLFDDGLALRSASVGPPVIVADSDVGNSADEQSAARIERSQAPSRSLPAVLTLSYYDASRDYQTSQMRGSIGDAEGRREQIDLPMVMSAGAAKALVESQLARRWAERDMVTLRLPPRLMTLQPGSAVRMTSDAIVWAVHHCAIEGMVTVVHLRPEWRAIDAIAGDAGRSLPSSDSPPAATSLALVEVPDLGIEPTSGPTLYLAASSPAGRWAPVPIEVSVGGTVSSNRAAARKAVLGAALDPLADGQPWLIDAANNVQVELVDQSQWLESCDDDALVQGSNLAAIGSELIQFGRAEPTGPGRFRLSRLVRGRRGSEYAMALHEAGDAFVLIQPGALRRLDVASSAHGATIEVRATGLGDSGAVPVSRQIGSETLRPPSPTHVRAWIGADGGLNANWMRRSRHGWAWVDEMDAPLGEIGELYRVVAEGVSGRIELETGVRSASFDSGQVASLGTGAATLAVQQIGDRAASRPAKTDIMIA